MVSYKATVEIEKGGELTLHSLPFHSGERVRVAIESAATGLTTEVRFPLRRTPYRYDAPFEAAENFDESPGKPVVKR